MIISVKPKSFITIVLYRRHVNENLNKHRNIIFIQITSFLHRQTVRDGNTQTNLMNISYTNNYTTEFKQYNYIEEINIINQMKKGDRNGSKPN